MHDIQGCSTHHRESLSYHVCRTEGQFGTALQLFGDRRSASRTGDRRDVAKP